jgi:hypothetical protein
LSRKDSESSEKVFSALLITQISKEDYTDLKYFGNKENLCNHFSKSAKLEEPMEVFRSLRGKYLTL